MTCGHLDTFSSKLFVEFDDPRIYLKKPIIGICNFGRASDY
jgi:hypothetical protein